jgi:hypothetical protein
MTCRICAYLGNLAVLADQAVNAILGGRADQTVSQRLALARNAGVGWAVRACAVLAWISRRLGNPGDHCDAALDPGASTLRRETWRWGGQG